MTAPTVPRVHLVGYTEITDRIPSQMAVDPGTAPGDALAEYAGRKCYGALHKPNPATRANRDYLRNIIDLRHFSVLAHAGAAFELEGVSRSFTHELIRAVFLAYSQESQRYVVPRLELEAIRPPDASDDEYDEIAEGFREELARYGRVFDSALARFHAEGDKPRDARKRAAAVARAVLPNSTPTCLIVSGNYRAWRDFLAQRLPADAEAEIRGVAEEIRAILVELVPATFQDLA